MLDVRWFLTPQVSGVLPILIAADLHILPNCLQEVLDTQLHQLVVIYGGLEAIAMYLSW